MISCTGHVSVVKHILNLYTAFVRSTTKKYDWPSDYFLKLIQRLAKGLRVENVHWRLIFLKIHEGLRWLCFTTSLHLRSVPKYGIFICRWNICSLTVGCFDSILKQTAHIFFLMIKKALLSQLLGNFKAIQIFKRRSRSFAPALGIRRHWCK